MEIGAVHREALFVRIETDRNGQVRRVTGQSSLRELHTS